MSREKIKTFILTILVVMTVLLTQKVWFQSPFQSISSDVIGLDSNALDLEQARNSFVSPIRVLMGFGGGRSLNRFYSVLSFNDIKSAWLLSKNVLEPFFAGDPYIELVSSDTYYENMANRFIELEFGDNISSVLVSSVFNKSDSKIIRNIREIKKIMIPANNTGIIYIIGKDSNCFRIVLDNYSNEELISYINAYEAGDFVKYNAVFYYVGNYHVVMPLSINIPMSQIYVESEIDITNDAQLAEKSRSFFRNIDFIKTIKETTGTVVYLYGYGEKSLRINNRGRLEYREEFDPVPSTNVKKALDTALIYMHQQGDMADNLFLREIKEIEYKGRKGFSFGFGYHLEGYPVYFNSSGMSNAIEIEVVGNQIRGYRTFLREKMNIPAVTKLEPIILPHNLIEMIIENYLAESDGLVDRESVRTDVLKSISEVQLVYFDSINQDKQ